MRIIVRPGKIKVIERQIVRYICDGCGADCGTRANPKRTWTGPGGTESHYCIRVCDGRRPRE